MEQIHRVGTIEELILQGMLYGYILRSPVASGTLIRINTPKLSSSYTLITARDIPGIPYLTFNATRLPIFASSTITYIGEPVALLVGPDRNKLEDILRSTEIIAEEEVPQFDCSIFTSDRIIAKKSIPNKDIDTFFKRKSLITEGTYSTAIQEHWYPECHGALASYSYDKMIIRTATQWPYHVRQAVATMLGVSENDIIVEPTVLGTHLDGKLWYPSLIACFAGLATYICKKPVKVLLSRIEDFQYSPKRPASKIVLRTATGKEGELIALESRPIVNMGSNGPFAEEFIGRLSLGTMGAYRCPHYKLEAYAVHSNLPPAGPLAGFGFSQANFAIESHIWSITDRLQINPLEWRKKNALCKGDTLIAGIPIRDAVPSEVLLDSVAAMSDFNRKWSSYELLSRYHRSLHKFPIEKSLRGIGVSLGYQGNGLLFEGADKGNFGIEVTLEKSGSLVIKTSAIISSEETQSIWAAIAEDILGIPASTIEFAPIRTDQVPDSGPSCLSRNTTIITKLVQRACEAIRKQRFRDPLPITVKRQFRPTKAMKDGLPFTMLSWGSAVVEVEIEPITLRPQTRGIWLIVDGGKILSEQRARRSIQLASLQALQWACGDNLSYENGLIPPEVMELHSIQLQYNPPPVSVEFLWNDSEHPKGIGELPFTLIPGAFAQAVSQAIGKSMRTLPIRSLDIEQALQSREELT
ncbi:xanthine dehydrogenase family protein molybdopterin-binding subunit [Gracilinema caldarium]|uniref:Xanthine dehydrogenase n=1 Tax=Gracilinema caldarium (strain ATCC 51460 / DSM 7334 / H1) TaxID=744872 RepID=F8EXL3_GRAC1|nr:molybdopterin cofactor-binding domain-containing protein [Gracilinema caldarium]AEJ19594.1 Xanthine dehydrogenase [Gracilinema caldarium DSM 7334]